MMTSSSSMGLAMDRSLSISVHVSNDDIIIHGLAVDRSSSMSVHVSNDDIIIRGLALDRSSLMSVHVSNDDIITHVSGSRQILVNVRPCVQ